MNDNGGKKQKSFLQSFTWIGIMLLAMGAVFVSVAVIMQLVPMSPENIRSYVNGVRQPSTEETVRNFRLIFLLVFGIIGMGMAVAGGIVAICARARRKRAVRLKKEGVLLTAEVTGYVPSVLYVNNRNAMRLQCAHTDSGGRTYIFKSDLLRMDPMPYLPQGQIDVYYDKYDMNRYFVDVDGSVGLGTRVIELG